MTGQEREALNTCREALAFMRSCSMSGESGHDDPLVLDAMDKAGAALVAREEPLGETRVGELPQVEQDAFAAFCREKWGDDLTYADAERWQAAAAWLAARDFYRTALAVHEGELREALSQIVKWDDREKPHKNLPLADCADLARAALAAREDTERPGGLDGIDLITAERERQVREEGWTREHDDGHVKGELALAAACYAVPLPYRLAAGWSWPFEPESFKRTEVDASPGEEIRDLVKAGALIAAEIDRLQRVRDTERPVQSAYDALRILERRVLDVSEPVAGLLNYLRIEGSTYRVIIEKVEASARAVLASEEPREPALTIKAKERIKREVQDPLTQLAISNWGSPGDAANKYRQMAMKISIALREILAGEREGHGDGS